MSDWKEKLLARKNEVFFDKTFSEKDFTDSVNSLSKFQYFLKPEDFDFLCSYFIDLHSKKMPTKKRAEKMTSFVSANFSLATFKKHAFRNPLKFLNLRKRLRL